MPITILAAELGVLGVVILGLIVTAGQASAHDMAARVFVAVVAVCVVAWVRMIREQHRRTKGIGR